MATYLIQKPGESVWYVRMAVPVDVRHAFGGRAKLIKTTGTSNKSEAMVRRLPILAQWTADIAAARQQRIIARERWLPETAAMAEALDSRISKQLMSASRGTISFGDLDPEEREFRKSLVLNELRLAIKDPELSESVFAILDKAVNATSEIAKVQGLADFSRAFATHLTTSSYDLTAPERAQAEAIIRNPNVYRPVSPLTERRLELFRLHRVAAAVALKTIDQQESKLKDLSAYLKSEGKRLDKSVVSAWLAAKPISSKTKTQYLLAGSTFWQWALDEDAQWQSDFAGMNNPFAGHKLPKRKVAEIAKNARKAFSPDELQRVFNAAKDGNQRVLSDLILLGSLTGCRIEEIVQLTKASVVTVEGIRCFKLDDAKTVAGAREIPIHPVLAPIVDRLIAASKDGFLLHSSAGNKYDIRSDSLSKAFGRLKTSLGFGRQHVFHSVRGMVITQLLRAGIPGNVVANIVGHETGLVTFDVYDEGASPQQKLDALCKLPTLEV